MTRHWLLLIAAGLSEIGWVSGLKHADSAWTWGLTAAALLFSFYMLMYVTRVLPVGTAYAAFTGIGAAGTVLGESVFFGVPLSEGKLALVAVMICGIAGLKLTAGHKEGAGQDGHRRSETARHGSKRGASKRGEVGQDAANRDVVVGDEAKLDLAGRGIAERDEIKQGAATRDVAEQDERKRSAAEYNAVTLGEGKEAKL